MRKSATIITTAASVAALLGGLAMAPAPAYAEQSVVEEGKQIAFNKKKGNCLACHQIEGGNLPGNIGPPLVAMQQRFDSKADLREQIAYPLRANPQSAMPPFARHNILSDEEIDKITEYIWTL